ncbi:MAG: hypothetical protein A2408_00340 [Candidatus Yonathbacteria bacterium RIFOXYC1_FULL_52_10]|uniref:DUF4352 domain-containing protein n=1 Tax=Candidatus Yonathbacteria bacterium RIFOXYD1_FULL_52_36 TaxID=1802730 RepID=A0A1G2SMF3_9BACT|nr:MAG: hypothetical protein A2408_00340 [Candidatus Yonathbacteria bacterium RIFOXYC1_FULL_52_10]OHA86260.1 MAG: hypothetical protein A2591_01710 [Candidatus Yonathbacteria bacterium RIFOXYD1_FULL_52_36]
MLKKNLHAIRAFFTVPKIPSGIFVLFLLAAILVTWFSVMTGYQTKESDLAQHHKIGETLTAPGLTFAVESVRQDAVGAGPLAPRPGYAFIVPTIEITNTGTTPIELAPLLHFHVRDRAGNVYVVAAIPSQGAQFSGSILPGDTIREELGFEVAQHVSDLTLYFEPGTVDRSMFAVDLTPQNTSWWSWRK